MIRLAWRETPLLPHGSESGGYGEAVAPDQHCDILLRENKFEAKFLGCQHRDLELGLGRVIDNFHCHKL